MMKKPLTSVTSMPNRNRLDARRATNHHESSLRHVPIPKHPVIAPNDDKDEEGRSSTPNLLSAEMWLLQGGVYKKGNIVPTVVVPSTSKTSKSSNHPTTKQQSRGRSPNHRILSSEKVSQPAAATSYHQSTASKQNNLVVASTSSSSSSSLPSVQSSTKRHVATTTNQNAVIMNQSITGGPSKTRKDIPSVPVCPIPSIYVSHIRKAFGGVDGASTRSHHRSESVV